MRTTVLVVVVVVVVISMNHAVPVGNPCSLIWTGYVWGADDAPGAAETPGTNRTEAVATRATITAIAAIVLLDLNGLG